MLLHILAVGDVVSERGLDCLHHHLRALKKEHDIHFTVVNGENAAGLGRRSPGPEPLYPAPGQLCPQSARPGLRRV